MRVLRMCVLATFLAASAVLPAQTQDPNWNLCNGSDPDQLIAGCTALIQSGHLSSVNLAAAYNNRGNAYVNKGEHDQAIQDFNKAIQLDPSYAQAFSNRGIAYSEKGAYEQAIQDFNRALRLNPSDVNAFNGRGLAYSAKGEHSQAIADFSRAIALQPNNADALGDRCFAYAVVGQLQPALADCNQSLTLRPKNAGTLDSRCFVYLKMNNTDAAIADCDAALGIDPRMASSLYGRGLAERIKGDTAESNAYIAVAKAIQPNIDSQFAKWGVPMPAVAQTPAPNGPTGLIADFKAAMQDMFDESIAEIPPGATASNAAIDARLEEIRTAKFTDVETMMLKDTAIKPDMPALWGMLGEAQFGLKKYVEAEAAYKKGLELLAASTKSDSYAQGVANTSLGELYARTGRVPEAQAAFDAAAKVDPARAAIHFTLEARIFSQLHNGGAQAAAADEAIKADPGFANAYYLKGAGLIAKAEADQKSNWPVPPPGCLEAFQKYLELAPAGAHAAEVKAFLDGIRQTPPSSNR